MKAQNTKYVLVKRIIEDTNPDEFGVVNIQDSFEYKGEVISIPNCPLYVDNHKLSVGDNVVFAKCSPDSHDVEHEGQKMKMIKSEDILYVI